MILDDWAYKWRIDPAAVADLRRMIGAADVPAAADDGTPEQQLQNTLRLEASKAGARLWRNNVGVAYDNTGRYACRYGLANDTQAVNRRIKSSDLIGLRPMIIQPHHVGATFGQFVAIEVKRPSWQYRGTDREAAQLRYLELIISLGGYATFASGPGVL